MLHKSFKPAKCKTALKLATSRIKLLKNKKEAQVKQLKGELAKLLEAGQDRTARIRIEHVVRDEKQLEAYDLIEIYCELIVARLPIIESQKNCPIDLKEAISSVIFASPRCADIPELMDVRKHFTAKYGKEFVSAAVELRPECGVSRLLVEKLSTRAPDGPTKIKILSAIAEEHNVKWDPKSFEEKDIREPEDLLNGPNTFEQASRMHLEPPNVQEPPNSVDKRPPNFQVPPTHHEKHEVPVKSYGPNVRPLGTGAEGTAFRHPYAGDGSGFSASGQSWNMEFKDATAAAQAAAESAERASMAARAAAELSSRGRITRQHSTQSHKKALGSRHEGLQNYVGLTWQGEHVASDPNTIEKSNSGVHHEESDAREPDEIAGLAERFYNLKSYNISSQLASSNSNSASVDDYPTVNDFQMADRHSRKSSSGLEKSNNFGEASVKRESSESDEKFQSEVQDESKAENAGYFKEASIRKQSSSFSSRSQFQSLSDDHNLVSNVNQHESGKEVVEGPYTGDEIKIQRNIKDTNSLDNATAVFDDSGSDDDDFNFDAEDKHYGQDSSLYISSEGRSSSSHLVANTNAWGPRGNTEEGKLGSQSLFASERRPTSLFSEGLTSDAVPLQQNDWLPVTFDASDDPSSESEEEWDRSKFVGSTTTGIFPHEVHAHPRNPEPTKNESPHSTRSFAEQENMGSNRKTCSQPSSLDSDVVEVHTERKNGIEIRPGTVRKFGSGDSYTGQPSPRYAESRSNLKDFNDNFQTSRRSSVNDNAQIRDSPDAVKDGEPNEESTLETGKELNFGILTGGLRNKGFRHPPYHGNPLNKSLLSKQAEEDTSTRIEQSSFCDQDSYDQIVRPKVNKKASSRATYCDPADDYSDEELPQQTFSSSQEQYNRKAGVQVNKKSSLRTYFDSDDSDSEDDLPKQTLTSKTHSGTRFSRRTKASPLNSDGNSYPKATVPPKSSATADNVVQRKSSSSSLYPTETQPKHHSQTTSLDDLGSSKQRGSAEQAASKPIPQSKRLSHESSSRSSYVNDNQLNPLRQSKGIDYQGSSKQHRSAEQAVSEPIPESKRSLPEETLKSSARDQLSKPPPRTVPSGSSESSKTSSSHGETPSRENSISRAAHVHPNLPDIDTLTAHLLSLRQNRQ